MNDFVAPDMAYAGFALAATVLYAAWHEFASKNPRDARLLAAVGTVGLVGSTAVWVQGNP